MLSVFICKNHLSKKGKFMFKKYITLILTIGILFFVVEVNAQCPGGGPPPCGSGPGGGGPPGNPPPPPGKPIDGGLAILVALGAAYGIKKLKKED